MQCLSQSLDACGRAGFFFLTIPDAVVNLSLILATNPGLLRYCFSLFQFVDVVRVE